MLRPTTDPPSVESEVSESAGKCRGTRRPPMPNKAGRWPFLLPEERSLRARAGAHALHAKYDSMQVSQSARDASPGSSGYWERRVDPNGTLAPTRCGPRSGRRCELRVSAREFPIR
jgi:hypothetical protein